ncbi:MAG: MerR family transcriptional regulator [Candidatus Omnitrophica bacterium]|nr:MerR family transcriptional regulator [Candidatus Omnitrophota bacterium]
MAKLISTKEIAQKYNLSYQIINHYVRVGLLPIAKRNGFRRLFDEIETKKRMKKIIELKDKGYTLALIRDQLEEEGNK